MTFFLKKHSIVPPVLTFCLPVAAMTPRLPQLQVLFTTGFSRSAVFYDAALDRDVTVIPKRFTMEQHATKARSVLGGSSS